MGQKLLNGEEIVEGTDLLAPGYESVTIRDGANGTKVVVGSAWAKITKDNMDEMNF
jgi:hypothetical protein